MFEHGLNLTSVEEVRNEIINGRAQEQLFPIAGKRKYYSPDWLEIDVLKLMENLEKYEVGMKPVFFEHYDNNCDFVPFYIEDFVKEKFGYMRLMREDNTFNQNIRISNHIDFAIYQNKETQHVVFAMKVHLHGDVRANYSPYMLFAMSEEEFFEIWNNTYEEENYECGHLKINVRVGLNSEDIEVTVEDNKADDENYFDISTYSEKIMLKLIAEEIGVKPEDIVKV